MNEWDKLCELMTDLAELYSFTKLWGRTKAEGDKLQELEKKHYQYALDANKRLGECRQKIEAIRELLRNAPVPPEEIPDMIMGILGESIDNGGVRTQ